MAHRRQSIDPSRVLSSLIPDDLLRTIAKEVGLIVRQRKLDIVALFWTLVLGFGSTRKRRLSGLRRTYQKRTGLNVVPSSFYDWFTPTLVRFQKQVLLAVLPQMALPTRALTKRLASFADLLVADATVIKLHDLLKETFPGCRTNASKAAAKLHLVMSVVGRGPRSVRITPERTHESTVLSVGPWVKDRLLLFDLGYFKYQLFARIEHNGGYFISRLKANANPTLTTLLRKVRGRSIAIASRKLKDVLPELERQVLDAMAQVTFKRRSYRGKSKTDTASFRVIAVRNAQTDAYHLYITNIPPERLSAEEIAQCYAARWEVELLFRQLKEVFHLAELPSRKSHIVEALLYAALFSLMAARSFWLELCRVFPTECSRWTPERWSAIFEASAEDLLALRFARHRDQESSLKLLQMWFRELPDPNLKRGGGLVRRTETANCPS
jgi:IS4 transposase